MLWLKITEIVELIDVTILFSPLVVDFDYLFSLCVGSCPLEKLRARREVKMALLQVIGMVILCY